MSLQSFSQTDTNKKDTLTPICLPYTVAQKIAADLVRFDSCIAELQSKELILKYTNDKYNKQVAITNQYQQKYDYSRLQLKAKDEQISIYKTNIDNLSKQNKKLNKKVKVLGITTGGSLFAILLLLITK